MSKNKLIFKDSTVNSIEWFIDDKKLKICSSNVILSKFNEPDELFNCCNLCVEDWEKFECLCYDSMSDTWNSIDPIDSISVIKDFIFDRPSSTLYIRGDSAIGTIEYRFTNPKEVEASVENI